MLVMMHADVGSSAEKAGGGLAVKEYLNSSAYSWHLFNPVFWWRTKKNDPRLAGLIPMARKFLCVPATARPAANIFLHDRLVTEYQRNQYSSAVLDQMLFLHANLR